MGGLLGGGGLNGEQGDEGGAANFLLDLVKSKQVSHDADAAGSADFLSRGQVDGVVNEMGDSLGGGGFNGEQGDEGGAANFLLDIGKSKPVSHDADAAGSADFLSWGQADGVVNEMGDLLGGGGFNGEQGDEGGTANFLLDI